MISWEENVGKEVVIFYDKSRLLYFRTERGVALSRCRDSRDGFEVLGL